MSLRRLSINASAAVAQVGFVTLALLGLYALMVESLGIDRVGIWSLVMSVVAIGKVGEMGLGGAVLRFASRSLGGHDAGHVKSIILSAAVSTGLLTGLLAAGFYPLAWIALDWVIADPAALGEARILLPFALIVMCLMALVTVFFSVIDAFQKSWCRCLLVSLASVCQLGGAYWLLPRYGLMGLAWLQVAHAAFILLGALIISATLLIRIHGRWRWLPRAQFIEFLRYGTGLQMNTVAQLLFDPCTKTLLTYFGGLTLTGYYEVANRAVTQLKSLAVAAFQMLIPYVAGRYPTVGDDLRQLSRPYLRVFTLMQALVCCFLPVLLAGFPVIFPLWLSMDAAELLVFASLCALGWSVNLLSVPAYMFALACGKVRWTFESHLAMGVLNVLLGGVGGYCFGGTGVVLGAMGALALGSITVIFRFNHALSKRWRELLAYDAIAILFINLVVIGTLNVTGRLNDAASTLGLSAGLISFAIACIICGVGFCLALRYGNLLKRIYPS